MEPITTAALIGGAASALGTGVNAFSQGQLNRKNRKWQEKMYQLQRQDALANWHMQNEYNDPSNQMARLHQAGLNPHLVYGSGAEARSAAPPQAAKPGSPSTSAPRVDLGSVVGNALMARQAEANIARTEAETRALEARTTEQNFINQVNEAVGVESIMAKQTANNDYLDYKYRTERLKLEAEMEALFRDPDGKRVQVHDPNSIFAKALRAGLKRTIVEAKSAAELKKIREFEAVIKKFEAGLAEEGISPNSPWYVKIMGDLFGESVMKGFRKMGEDRQRFDDWAKDKLNLNY